MIADDDWALFAARIRDAIPQVAAMDMRNFRWDGQRLKIQVPLAPNHNDKGTAFAGSLSASANLAGWAMTTWLLRHQGPDHPVVIRSAQQEYLRPVSADFDLLCEAPSAAEVDAFLERLAVRGKARLDLVVEVRQGGECCFRHQGAYVALLPRA